LSFRALLHLQSQRPLVAQASIASTTSLAVP
jgi:hypothetical protein